MRHHQDHDPYGETEQYDRRINSRDRPHERCHALAAPESRENGEDVSEHGGEYGDDLDIYQPHIEDVEPRFVCAVGENAVVFHQVDDRHGDESLQHVQSENRQGRALAQHAQHVGRAGVLAAVFADVDAVIFFAYPYGAGDRAEQVGDDYHRDNAIVSQYHALYLSGLYMQI